MASVLTVHIIINFEWQTNHWFIDNREHTRSKSTIPIITAGLLGEPGNEQQWYHNQEVLGEHEKHF